VLPKGPSSIVGTFLRYCVDPYGTFSACARRFGDPFYLPIPGTGGTVVATEPESVGLVLGAVTDTFDAFRTEASALVLGEHTLFFESGLKHRASRRILSGPFHGSHAKSWSGRMASIAAQHVETWQPGMIVRLQHLGALISMDVVLRAVLGISDEARIDRFRRAIAGAFDTVGPAVLFFKWLRHEFGGFGPWARAQRMVRELNRLLEEEIADRAQRPSEGDDVLSALLAARSEGIQDDEIRDKLFDMLIAGYETTAIAVAWSGYDLLRNPTAEERLRAELATLDPKAPPEAYAMLPYLEAVAHETLRIHPIFSLLTRRVARPLAIKEFVIPPGMGASVAIAPVHHSPRVYEEPLAFRPERFLGRTYSPFEYLPFGGGAQRCIGATFALHLLRIVIATLFSRFRLRLSVDRPVRPIVRSATTAPKGGIEVVVVERLDQPRRTRRSGSVRSASAIEKPVVRG
jgi:cytochrome P450